MTKVLSISIHVDDSEYSIGGTMKLLKDKGCDVTCVNITPNFRDADREHSDTQSIEASAIVGAKKIILDYETQDRFYAHNKDTVRKLEAVLYEERPDILFMMYPTDNHLEHVECAKTASEAIFRVSGGKDKVCPNEIYSVECGPFQSMRYFDPHLYIGIDSVIKDVEKCMLYFQQAGAWGPGLWEEKEVAARFRGYEMATCVANAGDGRSVKYAEGFRIEKYPKGKSDFLLRQILKDSFCWCSLNMYHPNAHPVFRS